MQARQVECQGALVGQLVEPRTAVMQAACVSRVSWAAVARLLQEGRHLG